jgi:hypothetical protein
LLNKASARTLHNRRTDPSKLVMRFTVARSPFHPYCAGDFERLSGHGWIPPSHTRAIRTS